MTTYKDKISGKDISGYDGGSRTFQRRSSTGANLSLPKVGNMVDVLATFGDGETVAEATFLAAVGAITSECTLELAPGSWPITSNLTLGSNFSIRLRRGATFAVSGGVTLDASACYIFPEEATWYTGAGTVTVDNAKVRNIGGNAYVETMQFNTNPTLPTAATGLMFWDTTNKTLSAYMDDTDVILQMGQEIQVRARNNTGSTITNGSVVYVSGATGNRPTIALAKADAFSTTTVIGVATHDIANNADGYVTTRGEVRDYDTSSFSAEGAVLYLSATTAGEFTETPPSTTGTDLYVARVAVVTVKNANTGKIQVFSDLPLGSNDALGTSDLFPPTQKAVKSYVDTSRLGCRLRLYTANQTLTTATPTDISFDNNEEVFDVGGWHDGAGAAPTRLTVPTGVSYAELSANIAWESNATGGRWAIISGTVGGVTSTVASARVTPGEAATWYQSLSTGPIAVTAGDYFVLTLYQNSGGNLDALAGTVASGYDGTNFTVKALW